MTSSRSIATRRSLAIEVLEDRAMMAVAPLPLVSVQFTAGLPDTILPFHVTLDKPSDTTITVNYATVDGTLAQVAPYDNTVAGKDYVPTGGVLVFNPGQVDKVVPVQLLPQVPGVPNKALVLIVFNPTNAQVSADVSQQGNIGRIISQVPPPAFAGADTIQEFTRGFTGHPAGMFLGPDGNFWFTEQFEQKIGMFDPRTQTATEFDVPGNTFPHNGAVGPDGNLWFVGMADAVFKFDLTTHAITVFRDGITPHATPHTITAAPDGFLYFSEQDGGLQTPDPKFVPSPGNGRLGRIDPTTGQITEFSVGLPPHNLMHGVITGPDGNIWMALQGTSQVARFNIATQTFDRFAQFPPGTGPIDLVTGPDGNIYASLQLGNELGVVNPQTLATRVIPTSLSRLDGPSVDALSVGADGRSIWFVEFQNDRVVKYDIPTQTVTEYFKGITPNSAPLGIDAGPDGNEYFSEINLNLTQPGRFARVVPTPESAADDPSTAFVTSVFRDVLGHDPDPASVSAAAASLNAGGSRSQVVKAILKSPDVLAQAVNDLYRTFLQRDAGPDEVSTAVGLLQKGVSLDRLRLVLVGSPEYFQNRGGGTRAGFMTAMLGDVFGFPVAARTQQKFTRLANQGATSEQLARQVLYSTEAKQALIGQLDRRFLLRPANTTAANDFANPGRTTDQIAARILASPEYFSFRILSVPRKTTTAVE